MPRNAVFWKIEVSLGCRALCRVCWGPKRMLIASLFRDWQMGRWMDGYPGFPISIGVRRIQGGHMMMPLRDHQVAMFLVYIVFSIILC